MFSNCIHFNLSENYVLSNPKSGNQQGIGQLDLSRQMIGPYWIPALLDNAPRIHHFCTLPYYDEGSLRKSSPPSITIRLSLNDNFGESNPNRQQVRRQGQRPKTLVQYIPPGKISTIEITPRQGLPLRKQSSLSNGEHVKGRKKARKNSINTSTTTPLRIKLPFDQN